MGRHLHREHAESAVAELVERSSRQLADCVDLLEASIRSVLAGEHECAAATHVLLRLGPALFPVCTFFTGLIVQLVAEVVAIHEATGSTAGETVADDLIQAARRAAAMQLDGMETVLHRQIDERFGRRP